VVRSIDDMLESARLLTTVSHNSSRLRPSQRQISSNPSQTGYSRTIVERRSSMEMFLRMAVPVRTLAASCKSISFGAVRGEAYRRSGG